MTLEELNGLSSDARAHETKAMKAEALATSLAAIRNGEAPLMVRYKGLGGWQDDVRSAIEGVINEHGADLLRIVEMRLAAHARQEKTFARAKRDQLSTIVSVEEAA